MFKFLLDKIKMKIMYVGMYSPQYIFAPFDLHVLDLRVSMSEIMSLNITLSWRIQDGGGGGMYV